MHLSVIVYTSGLVDSTQQAADAATYANFATKVTTAFAADFPSITFSVTHQLTTDGTDPWGFSLSTDPGIDESTLNFAWSTVTNTLSQTVAAPA